MELQEQRLINPFLLIGAILVVAVGLTAGFFLTRDPGPVETEVTLGAEPAGPLAEPTATLAPQSAQARPTEAPTGPTRLRGYVVNKSNGIRVPNVTVNFAKVRDLPKRREDLYGHGFGMPGFTPLGYGGESSPKYSTILSATQNVKQDLTNANGEFRFDPFDPGQWLVWAPIPEGFATAHSGKAFHVIQVATGETREGYAIDLVPSASFAVTVNSAFGKPVPGARVQAYSGKAMSGENILSAPWEMGVREDSMSADRFLTQAISDAEGKASLGGLEKGVYDIIAFATGFARQTLTNVRTGSTDREFRLEPEVRVVGQVIQAESEVPLPGATVEFTFEAKDLPFSKDKVIADASGFYRIGNLPRQSKLTIHATTKEMESSQYTLLFRGAVSEHRRDLRVFRKREVKGKVVDAYDKSPIEGAQIALTNNFVREKEITQTDAEGWFSFETGGSSNRIGIGKEGYRERTALAVFNGEASSLLLPVTSLVQGVTVTGKVVDAKTKIALGGVAVKASHPLEKHDSLFRPVDGKTDAAGKFLLSDVPPGDIALTAIKSGYLPMAYNQVESGTGMSLPILEVFPQTPVEDLLLEMTPAPLVKIQGTVRSATGSPITGALVEMRPKSQDATTSSEEGAFTFDEVPFGQYDLFASGEGYFPGGVDSIIADATSANRKIEIVLEKDERLSISGKVVDDAGNPVGNSEITALLGGASALVSTGILNRQGEIRAYHDQDGSGRPGDGAGARSNADGTYQIKDLRPGTYTVIAGKENPPDVEFKYDIAAGSQNVDFTFSSGGAISGTVFHSDGQTPATLFSVEAKAVSVPGIGSTDIVSAFTAEPGPQVFHTPDGGFEIPGLPEGIYTLNFLSDEAGEAHLFGIEVGPQGNSAGLTVVLNAGGFMYGNVVDTKNLPIAGAKVHLGESVKETWPEDGGFEFGGLAPDTYALVVTHRDYPPAFVDNLVLQEGIDLDIGNIQMGGGGSIVGNVVFENGAGASDYTVQAEPENLMLMGALETSTFVAETDPAGYFALDNLSAGGYRLILREGSGFHYGPGSDPVGTAVQTQTVQVADGEETPVQFVIGDGVRLSGTVLVNGQPLSRSSISLFPKFETPVTEYTALTDAFGRYSFQGIPPGTYEAIVAEFSEDAARNLNLNVPEQPEYQHDIRY
jgi:hypothetical protein